MALDIDITINLYDKRSLDKILEIIRSYRLDKPVFIIDERDRYRIKFNSDYEQFELKSQVATLYEDHSYFEDIEGNQRDLVLSFHTSQSPLSTSDWGARWNEDYIYKSYYLVKNGNLSDRNIINNHFSVLIDNELKQYTVHIAEGQYKDSENKFYVVTKDEFIDPDNVKVLSKKPLDHIDDAFWEGFYLLEGTIIEEHEMKKQAVKRKPRKKKEKE